VGRPVTISGHPVPVIAHRGYHQQEPENSLAAVAEALAMGVDGIEIDIRLAGDGTIVCFHDWYLKRLTGISGRVARLGIHRLLELPLQHPGSRRRRPVATLSDILALVEDRTTIVLDLKKETVRASDLEKKTIAELREFGLCESVVISSFNPWVLRRCRQLAPEFQTALIAGSRLAVRLFDPAYCNSLHLHYELLRRRWFHRLEKNFPRIMVWTVDRKGELDFPLSDNVHGIITNRPERWGVESIPRKRITLKGTENPG